MRDPSARRFWRARTRRRLPILVTGAVASLALALLLSLAAGLALRAPTSAVRSGFESVDLAARSVSISADLAQGSTVQGATVQSAAARRAQDATVDRAVRSGFGDAQVTIDRRQSGETVRYRIAPVVDRLGAGDLEDLLHGFRRAPDSLQTAFASQGGTIATGTGASTTSTILRSVQAVRETSPVPIAVLLVAGLIALAMLGRVVVVARAAEDRLLRSRGGSTGLLVGESAREAVWIAAPSVLVGGAVAQIALALLYGAPTGPVEVAAPLVVALLAAVACPTVATFVSARRPLERDSETARLGGSATSGGLAVLLLLLAALSVWRYRGAQDAAAVLGDPLALLSPAAVLAALAVLSTALLPGLLRIVEKALSGGTTLPRSLAVRFTARNVAVLAAPALLLALAVGVGSFAAGATSTAQSFLGDSARLTNGGAQRATVGGSNTVQGTGSLLAVGVRTPSAASDGVAPVVRTDGSLGDQSLSVLGVRSIALPRLAAIDPHLFDARAVAKDLGTATTTGTVPLAPASISGTTLTADVETVATSWATDPPAGTRPTATSTFWLIDSTGDTVPITSSDVPIGRGATATGSVRAEIPAGGPWRLAAVDFQVETPVDLAGVSVTVKSLSAGGRSVALPSNAWQPRNQVFGDEFGRGPATATLSASIRAVAAGSATGSNVRVMSAAPAVVPVAISEALASSAGLHIGDPVAVGGQIGGFAGRVTAIVPVLPGTSGTAALLADLPALSRGYLAESQQLPSAREVWAAQSSPRLGAVLGGSAVVATPSVGLENRFVQASATSLWLGAIGGGLFALLTVAATLAAIQRRRTGEVGILRSLGVTARVQARVRITEPAVVTVYALVTGAVIGLVTTVLVAPALVRTSAPSAPAALAIQTSVDTGGLSALLAGLVVVTALLLALQYTATRRAAGGAR